MAVQRNPDIFRQIRQPEESVRLAAVQAKGRTSDTCPPRPRLYNWRLSETIR